MDQVCIDKFNLNIVDTISVVQNCELMIIKDLDKFELLNEGSCNFRKKDVKTIFYFYILKQICDTVINNKSLNKCVFIYNKKCMQTRDMLVFPRCDTTKMNFSNFIHTMLRKFNSVLPSLFYMYDSSICFEDIKNDSSCGEIQDIVHDIKHQLNIKSSKRFTFEKAKKLIKDFGLTYLDHHYFNQVKIKSLIYK